MFTRIIYNIDTIIFKVCWKFTFWILTIYYKLIPITSIISL